MFSESSPCLLGQHGSCITAQRPVELSENILQNLPDKSVCILPASSQFMAGYFSGRLLILPRLTFRLRTQERELGRQEPRSLPERQNV